MNILMQHTPAARKKNAMAINWLKKNDLAVAGSVEIILSGGMLRRVAENERAAVYILLK